MAETRRRKETPATEPIRGASVETDAQEHALPPEPKASVMLIAHNQSNALRRALQALFASPAAGQFEVIVIDCASDDDPRAVGDAFPQATFLYLPDDFGATKAMNIAARSAKSAALFFVAPEIEISAEAVLQLAEHLENHSGDTAAVCPLLTKPDGEVAGQALPLPSRETLARACAGEAATYVAVDLQQESVVIANMDRRALMVRKQFVAGMNYFDERFGEYWADADVALKIRRAQRKIRLYPAIKAVWHAPAPASLDALHRADCISGAAVLLGKYEGAMASVTFRLSRGLNALLHADFRLLGALLSGEKIGSHAK